MVGGEERGPLDWGGNPVPSDVSGIMVGKGFSEIGEGIVVLRDSAQESVEFKIPCIEGKAKEVDLAFASADSDADGAVKTTFYMPIASDVPYMEPEHRLTPAQDVTFDDLRFSHYIGTKRE